MRISTRGRYGLRVLLDVALNQERGPVTLRDISGRQGISQKYLWQVLNPLKSAGFLHVTRGAQGGYVLARDPEDISLLDIVNTLEGAGSIVACVSAPETCGRSGSCTARGAWSEIETKTNDAMSAVTVRDLVLRHTERQAPGEPNYAI